MRRRAPHELSPTRTIACSASFDAITFSDPADSVEVRIGGVMVRIRCRLSVRRDFAGPRPNSSHQQWLKLPIEARSGTAELQLTSATALSNTHVVPATMSITALTSELRQFVSRAQLARASCTIASISTIAADVA